MTVLRVALIAFATIAIIGAYSPSHTGSSWQSQSAASKEKTLNTQINADHTPYGWYKVRIGELFTENLNTTFDFCGDDMPSQSFGLEERPKVIHSVGAIAPVKWISFPGHNYTGIFRGASNGFLRLSLANPPQASPPQIVPGLSLKILIDGQPSVNLVSMFSLVGQPSFNFFEHDLTNHAPNVNPAKVALPQKLLYNAFSKVSRWPTCLGISHFALYDENGNAEPEPNFPSRLVFHPPPSYRKLFPSAPQSGDQFFIPQLESIPANTFPYTIYAEAYPGSDLEKIGQLFITAPFSGSQYGDKDLFFQHHLMEADLELRPEWSQPLASILQWQSDNFPYTYPDQSDDEDM